MEKIYNMKLRENGKGGVHQVDARALKAALHEYVLEVFQELGLDAIEVQNAIMLEVPHEHFGAIPFEVKFIQKPINYDIISAAEQFEQKREAQRLREEAKAKAKQE